jgi:hypothetical protein
MFAATATIPMGDYPKCSVKTYRFGAGMRIIGKGFRREDPRVNGGRVDEHVKVRSADRLVSSTKTKAAGN